MNGGRYGPDHIASDIAGDLTQHPGLVRPLRAHAASVSADIAAVDLLIGHRTWLSRPDFRAHIHHHLDHQPGQAAASTRPSPGAWIDWPAALTALTGGRLPCARSEAAVLRIAAALGADTAVPLRQILGGLDRPTITLITDAITRANGA
jgi:hypothetical protein